MRVLVAVLATTLLATSAPAVADEPPAATDDMTKARETYQAGVAAYEAGLYKDAEEAFQDVYRLSHSPEVLYDLALAQQKQRKWGAAAESYDSYLRDSKKVKDRSRIQKLVADLRGRQQRQDEIDRAINEGRKPPEEVAATPGNEVLPLGDDSLLSIDDKPVPAPAQVAAPPLKTTADEGNVPIYKKWWLWAAVGGAVLVGAVIAIAVAATRPSAETTTFPDIGPGAALLRF